MVRHKAFAVAGLLVLGACGGGGSGHPVEISAAGPPPAAPPVEVTTTTAEPPPTTTAPPSTTTTTRPRPAPKPTSPAPDATRVVRGETMSAAYGPRPAGALVFAYQPGRTSWEGVSEGTTLRLRIDPTVVHTGELVHVFVEAHHPDRPICSTSVLFGDGGNGTRTDTGPGTAEFTHIYNRRGRYEFLFQAVVGQCGDHNLYPSMYGWIDVAAGTAPATSQGPQPPTVEALEARAPGEPAGTGRLQVWAKGFDADGYINRFVIDWGDATPAVSAPNAAYNWAGAGCKPGPSGWPGQHDAWLGQPYPEHQYATTGTYTVTVSAVSAGCDGRDEQTATTTFTYQVFTTSG